MGLSHGSTDDYGNEVAASKTRMHERANGSRRLKKLAGRVARFAFQLVAHSFWEDRADRFRFRRLELMA
jgi:hypothetical protein